MVKLKSVRESDVIPLKKLTFDEYFQFVNNDNGSDNNNSNNNNANNNKNF